MRKRLIGATPTVLPVEHDWLNLDHIARVEITSEDNAHPIESALQPGEERGWRAAGPGAQIYPSVVRQSATTAWNLAEFRGI